MHKFEKRKSPFKSILPTTKNKHIDFTKFLACFMFGILHTFPHWAFYT